MVRKKDLPVNIQCRMLVIKAARLASEIFYEEDAPPYDGRVVASKKRALDNALNKIEVLSGIPKKDFEPFPHNILWSYKQCFDAFRAVGVPIATKDDLCQMNKGEKECLNTQSKM